MVRSRPVRHECNEVEIGQGQNFGRGVPDRQHWVLCGFRREGVRIPKNRGDILHSRQYEVAEFLRAERRCVVPKTLMFRAGIRHIILMQQVFGMRVPVDFGLELQCPQGMKKES